MKNFILLFSAIFLVELNAAEIPFKKGFNLAGWFQVSSAGQIQFTRFSKDDFQKIKSMGIDHLRLPVPLHDLTLDDGKYTIDPLLFIFLDQVIDWVEELELYLIIDNHSFDVNISTKFSDLAALTGTWKQVADRYKDRSDLICYEILNEPHGISDILWNTMQQIAIDSIRSVDTTHTIIIGPAGWNSYHNLQHMLQYNDDKLIYTFHFYEPFLYTHQGASWTDPPLLISDVPYPYNSASMPPMPANFIGTWLSDSYNSYVSQGNREYLAGQLDIAASYMNQKDVPMWCGEFGAYLPNSTTEDRVRWLADMSELFEERGIAWAMWEFDGGFGVFEQGGNNMIDHDLNIPVIEALGLTLIPQTELIIHPDSSDIVLYDDFINQRLVESSAPADGTISFFEDEAVKEGSFCIKFSNAGQYGNVGLQFRPIRDLTYLVDQGYRLDLWLKSSNPNTKLDIRFVDSKNGQPQDHPWRIRYTVDNTKIDFDGTWQHLNVPLNTFTEHGSWDNEQWYEPVGDYNWAEVQKFEIVAEYSNLNGTDIYFDQIRITNPTTAINTETKKNPYNFNLEPNYPNPFNPTTTIKYTVGADYNSPLQVSLKIYDVLGRHIRTLVDRKQPAGLYTVSFNSDGLPSGIYYYHLEAGHFAETRKMVLMR